MAPDLAVNLGGAVGPNQFFEGFYWILDMSCEDSLDHELVC